MPKSTALTQQERKTWRYIAVAFAGAAAFLVWLAGWRLRSSRVSEGDSSCAQQTYVDVLGSFDVDDAVSVRAWTYAPYVFDAASYFSVPTDLLMGLIHTESRFNPAAGSGAGAVGLAQHIPSTAISRFKKLYEKGQWPFPPVTINADPQAAAKFRDAGVEAWLDRTSPQQSAWLGAASLRALFDAGYDVQTALAVYNAGPSVAGKPASQWPGQTQSYVPAVLQRASWYRALAEAC